jgi:hypothetical protein
MSQYAAYAQQKCNSFNETREQTVALHVTQSEKIGDNTLIQSKIYIIFIYGLDSLNFISVTYELSLIMASKMEKKQ